MLQAPDHLWYEREAPLRVVFRWSASQVDPDTVSWRIYNKVDGSDVLLIEVPVDQLIADVPVDYDTLRVVVVRAVDAQGAESADSPNLTFAPQRGHPVVTLTPWTVTRRTAAIGWSIASRSFLALVDWELFDGTTTLRGEGQADGSVEIPVKDFVGTLRFTLRARDIQDRVSRQVSEVVVWNVTPGVPELAAIEIGIHFIRVQATPALDGLSPTTQIAIEGPGGTVTLEPPFEHVFDSLDPATGYGFRAQALNASGYPSTYSPRLIVETLVDPDAPLPVEAAGYAGYIAPLVDLLTSEIMQYLLQLYSTTRLREPGAPQIVTPPLGFSAVLDYFMPLASRFGALLRAETEDEPSYRTSELIDQIGDPLHKLAIFCELLQYGGIWDIA